MDSFIDANQEIANQIEITFNLLKECRKRDIRIGTICSGSGAAEMVPDICLHCFRVGYFYNKCA